MQCRHPQCNSEGYKNAHAEITADCVESAHGQILPFISRLSPIPLQEECVLFASITIFFFTQFFQILPFLFKRNGAVCQYNNNFFHPILQNLWLILICQQVNNFFLSILPFIIWLFTHPSHPVPLNLVLVMKYFLTPLLHNTISIHF